jgi:hypothetical protein
MKHLKLPSILEVVAAGVGITALHVAGLMDRPPGTRFVCCALVGVAIGLGVISGREAGKKEK